MGKAGGEQEGTNGAGGCPSPGGGKDGSSDCCWILSPPGPDPSTWSCTDCTSDFPSAVAPEWLLELSLRQGDKSPVIAGSSPAGLSPMLDTAAAISVPVHHGMGSLDRSGLLIVKQPILFYFVLSLQSLFKMPIVTVVGGGLSTQVQARCRILIPGHGNGCFLLHPCL